MDETKICPKCNGKMKIGNFSGKVVNWEKEGEPNYLKQSGRKINTYACVKCGYLESYAK